MNGANDLFERYWRIAAVIGGVIVLLWILYALRLVMLPFLAGLALVYITLPLVSWVEARFPKRWRWRRTERVSAIAVVYILFVLVLGLLGFFVVSTIVDSLHAIAHRSTDYFQTASDTLKQSSAPLREIVPAELRDQMDTYLQDMVGTLLNYVHYGLMNELMGEVPSALAFVMGIAGAPFFVFYILKDREKFGSFISSLPGWTQPHVKNITSIFGDIVGRYVRASLVLGLVIGTLDLIGLLIIGAPMALPLAIMAGVTEMIPFAGPWIGGIVAVMVTLALAPEKTIWVALLFLAAQLLESIILVPRIQAAYFRIHPAIAVVLLTVGTYLAGAWGMILALPLASTTVEIYKYCCSVTQHQLKPEQDAIVLPDNSKTLR